MVLSDFVYFTEREYLLHKNLIAIHCSSPFQGRKCWRILWHQDCILFCPSMAKHNVWVRECNVTKYSSVLSLFFDAKKTLAGQAIG